MSHHTPGPWRVYRDETCWAEILPDGTSRKEYAVAQVAVSTEDEKANVNLIAAAPELLEALKLAVMNIEHLGYGKGSVADFGRHVIAKAEGKA